MLLQDAGLQALVAAANVVSVPSTVLDHECNRTSASGSSVLGIAPPGDSRLAPHPTLSVSAMAAAFKPGQAQRVESSAQTASWLLPCAATLQEGLATSSVAVKQDADTPSSKHKQLSGAKRRRKKRRDPAAGVTPEHMLYWVSQADVAAQLQCNDAVRPSEAASPLAEASAHEVNTSTAATLLPMTARLQQCHGDSQQNDRTQGECNRLSRLQGSVPPVPEQDCHKRRQCS